MSDSVYDVNCRLCPRLSGFLDEVGDRYPAYHARPVAAFGDQTAKLLIVGLAPGLHGANATGRPFTGDYAGLLLYETLHRLGLSNQAESVNRDDGLRLNGCRITNAVKCLPPGNKPTTAEVDVCNQFLIRELRLLQAGSVVLALGTIAHRAVLKARGHKLSAHRFAHGAEHRLGELTLIDSYHCSRYNTQTRRLTAGMFESVMIRARDLAASPA